MTATMTVAPLLPLLPAVLWTVSVAVCARSTCYLAVFAFSRGEGLYGRLFGWQTAAYALTSAASISAGAWQFGVPLVGLAAACAVLWARQRKYGKGEA